MQKPKIQFHIPKGIQKNNEVIHNETHNKQIWKPQYEN